MLFYILVDRLLRGLPTVLQHKSKSKSVYFDHMGAFNVLHLRDVDIDVVDKNAWLLCDSNDQIDSPNADLRSQCQTTVQASSPKISRYKEWIKQMDGMLHVIDPPLWSDVAFLG